MKAYIKAISYYLPDKVSTNDALVAEFPEWSVDKIVKKVGVNTRHIAADDETAGDMAVKAALRLFEQHDIAAADIDFILLCTQSPDYHLPTTACLVQSRLGVPTSAGALDYNLGCSGYIYGLSLAKGLIAADIAKNILLLTAETYTKYIDRTDKGNRSIFGDGAAATLVSTDGIAEIGEFVLGTDGRGAGNLIVETGGARHRTPAGHSASDASGAFKSPDRLYMDGSEIFNFTLDAVPPLVEQTLAKNGIGLQDVGYVVLHQANKFMLDTLRKVMGIDKARFYVDLSATGNTVSSTLPIALSDVLAGSLITAGTDVLIAGFGVGYSWGATVLRF